MPIPRLLKPLLVLAALLTMGPGLGVAVRPRLRSRTSRRFPPRTPDEERKALHLPPGFEIQLVAAEPDIHKPLNLAFDDRGRLWVTDTVEYPFPPSRRARRAATRSRSSRTSGPTAGPARSQTFADGLNIPIGLLPLPVGPRGARPQHPQHLPDDATPTATARPTRARCSTASIGHRDTHGMTNAFTWGFDGWIYACHGFSNDSTRAGERPSADHA